MLCGHFPDAAQVAASAKKSMVDSVAPRPKYESHRRKQSATAAKACNESSVSAQARRRQSTQRLSCNTTTTATTARQTNYQGRSTTTADHPQLPPRVSTRCYSPPPHCTCVREHPDPKNVLFVLAFFIAVALVHTLPRHREVGAPALVEGDQQVRAVVPPRLVHTGRVQLRLRHLHDRLSGCRGAPIRRHTHRKEANRMNNRKERACQTWIARHQSYRNAPELQLRQVQRIKKVASRHTENRRGVLQAAAGR